MPSPDPPPLTFEEGYPVPLHVVVAEVQGRWRRKDAMAAMRVGVGTTAPAGSTVLLKTGWTPGPDGLWVANSSGIVITRRATWIVVVFTDHLASLDDSLAILNHVCAAVAARLK
jgi:hypothetical protein